MGAKGSTESEGESAKKKEEIAAAKKMDKLLEKDQEKKKDVNKLLLLGTGESGKSTLFKQMTKLYGVGFTVENRKDYVSIVLNNVISNIATLCEESVTHANPPVDEKLSDSMKLVADLKLNEPITPEAAEAIANLWADKGIQSTYNQRHLYQIADSCQYLLSRVKELVDKDYLPNDTDILAVRARTTGVVQKKFDLDGNIFQIYDVGGQRSERKKWMNCFDNVTAVIFVVAISEFDQRLYEDEKVLRMTEALTLFDEMCNSKWFINTSMILFFNKSDLFREKLQTKSISVCYPEYKGSQSVDESFKYIKELFLSKNKQKDPSNKYPKRIYCHLTCAMDSHAMKGVFNAVKDIIISAGLKAAGLV